MAASFTPSKGPSAASSSGGHSQEPSIKPDRSWALLGQCVWALIDVHSAANSAVSSAEESWKNIQRKFSISNGSIAIRALESAAEQHVSFSQFKAAMRTIDPMNADIYNDELSVSGAFPSSVGAIKGFTQRVAQSMSKHGLWVRDRFALCILTLSRWVELVLLGMLSIVLFVCVCNCESIITSITLSDADAILSSPLLATHVNMDTQGMIYQDKRLTHDDSSCVGDIVSHLEEAMYIDSLLAKAGAADEGKHDCHIRGEEKEASLSAAYQKDAIAVLLNASYASLPPTLPAVVCAIGYVVRLAHVNASVC